MEYEKSEHFLFPIYTYKKLYFVNKLFTKYKMSLLDPNLYASIPIWIYITGGIGISLIINSIALCCCYKRIVIKEKELKRRELDLCNKEKMFNKKLQLKKQEYSDITISYPKKYSEYNMVNNMVNNI